MRKYAKTQRLDGLRQADAPLRACEHPDCAAPGLYPAPRTRERLRDYLWFCLDHVREYNKSWNYYAGMTADEIEIDRRRDITWRRPTWRMLAQGWRPIKTRAVNESFEEALGDGPSDSGGQNETFPTVSVEEAQAFAILDLHPPLTLATLKGRYRDLVKRHHPDANGGDKDAEERFKKIGDAYAKLKTRFLS